MKSYQYAAILIAATWSGTALGQACSADSDCPQGQVCVDDRCGSGIACTTHSDCPASEFCYEGSCLTGCRTHCDCPQDLFCYYGKCLGDPKTPVYCCSKPGCPPGRWCFESDGGKGTCVENPAYTCQSACDCGPAHCCKSNVCVKDTADPWQPGGTAILGLSCQEGVDATYCCGDALCYAGRSAYGSSADGLFRCDWAGVARNYCGGRGCYFGGDCEPGETCIDTRLGSQQAVAGALCNAGGGFCVSNAVAEAVYGWSPVDLLPACSKGCFPGMTCEVGWRPGGVYAVQRVTGTCGSCGNGKCEAWETAKTCAEDCYCGDGVCDTTEVESCPADCGTCGDGLCNGLETPKTCPADCKVVAGDGSCDASEFPASSDCFCAASPNYADTPIWCGDGVCQAIGDIPESSVNCPADCTISLTMAPSTSSICDGSNTQVTFTYVVTNKKNTGDVAGSVTDDKLGSVGSFGPLGPGATATLTTVSAIHGTTTSTATATGTFNDSSGTKTYALARATVSAHPCDTSPPTITLSCPGTVNLNATAYASVSVTDTESGVAYQSAPDGSDVLDTSTVGPKIFTVTATDGAGNSGSNSCAYQVVYDFEGAGGFLPPVANPPALNAAKAGRTIPVKWQLPDGRGGYVGDLGAVTGIALEQVQCSDLSSVMTTEVTATASGSSGLRYDTTANQFVFNWQTGSTLACTCQVLVLKLDDGSEYFAHFALR